MEALWDRWALFTNACPEAGDLEENLIYYWKEACEFFDVPEDDNLHHIEDEFNIQLFNLVSFALWYNPFN